MKKDLTTLVADFGAQATSFLPQALPMLDPSRADMAQSTDFLAYLNQLEAGYEAIRRTAAAEYIAQLVPYQAGQVLDVDTSWTKRKRYYYKGARRFLVKWISPYYWRNGDGGELSKIFINVYGCYLSDSGEVLLPEHNNGLPLQPGEWQPERISLNVGGEVTKIIGLAADQAHKFAELEAKGQEVANA